MKSSSAWTSRINANVQGRDDKVQWKNHVVSSPPSEYRGVAGCGVFSYTQIQYQQNGCFRKYLVTINKPKC